MPKRGQRQPYRVLTIYPPSDRLPEGNSFTTPYDSASEADNEAAERAARGATCAVYRELTTQAGNLTWYQVFVYTPENAHLHNSAERNRIYTETDILRWYRKQIEPVAVNRPTKNSKPISQPIVPQNEQVPVNEEFDVTKQEATPTDVEGALRYLLGPDSTAVVHDADRLVHEPYVMLTAADMAKILNRLPKDTW